MGVKESSLSEKQLNPTSFVCKSLMPQYETVVKSKRTTKLKAQGPRRAGVVLPYLRFQCLDQPLTQPAAWRRKAGLPSSALGQEGAYGQALTEGGQTLPRLCVLLQDRKQKRARCHLWAQGEKRASRPGPSFGG